MALNSKLLKEDSSHLEVRTQRGTSEDSPVNHALSHVAQMVFEILQHTYPVQDAEEGFSP